MTVFPYSGNVFFNECFIPGSGNGLFHESFIPAIGERFSLQWKRSTLLESSFLLAKTVTDTSGNYFLKIDRPYSCQWRLIFQLMETIFSIASHIFQEVLLPASGNTFFSPELIFLLVEIIIQITEKPT